MHNKDSKPKSYRPRRTHVRKFGGFEVIKNAHRTIYILKTHRFVCREYTPRNHSRLLPPEVDDFLLLFLVLVVRLEIKSRARVRASPSTSEGHMLALVSSGARPIFPFSLESVRHADRIASLSRVLTSVTVIVGTRQMILRHIVSRGVHIKCLLFIFEIQQLNPTRLIRIVAPSSRVRAVHAHAGVRSIRIFWRRT